MGNVSFDYAKGRSAYYASLPTGGDSLIALLLLTSGIESDSGMIARQFLNDVLAHSTEDADASYARKTLASVTYLPDTSNHWTIISAANPQWLALAGSNVSALVVAYKPNGGTDTTTRPLTKHDFSVTPDGSDVTATIPANGIEKIT